MLLSFPLRSVSLGLFVYSMYTLRALFLVLPLFVEYTSFYLSEKKKKNVHQTENGLFLCYFLCSITGMLLSAISFN